MFVFQTYDKACTLVLKIKPTLNYAKPETDGADQLVNHVINNLPSLLSKFLGFYASSVYKASRSISVISFYLFSIHYSAFRIYYKVIRHTPGYNYW